jgi:hypothetical protein
VQAALAGKDVVKTIVLPGKMVNFVVRPTGAASSSPVPEKA